MHVYVIDMAPDLRFTPGQCRMDDVRNNHEHGQAFN